MELTNEEQEYINKLLDKNKDYAIHLERCIKKIYDARPGRTTPYTDGVTDGLMWAVRILLKDKSAY